MDADISRASAALRMGRPLEALSGVGSRRDAHAEAVRGIALAQLGEYERGRSCLSRALRLFRRAGQPVWMAKAQAAIAEIDLATRDLVSASRALDSAALRRAGDTASAAYVDILRARLLAILGRHRDSQRLLDSAGWGPAAVLARAELLAFRGRFAQAARVAARVRTRNPLLAGEAERLGRELRRPSLRFRRDGQEREISLAELEGVRGPYVDAVRKRLGAIDLSRRPATFELLLALARGPVRARTLFPGANESHVSRLKVEVGRLRRATGLDIRVTPRGYRCANLGLLLPGADPIESLLSDGELWPPRAIAVALGLTVRSVQRALEASPRILGIGRGRSRRYRLRGRGTGIATQMLLLSARA